MMKKIKAQFVLAGSHVDETIWVVLLVVSVSAVLGEALLQDALLLQDPLPPPGQVDAGAR